MARGTDDLDEPPEEFGSELLTSSRDWTIIYALAALIVLMGVFVLYTSFQLKQVDEERAQLLAAMHKQDEHLVCFADTSTEFQLVLADVIQAGDVLSPLLRAQLQSSENRLRDVRNVCLGTVVRPVAPGASPTTR